eukprot:Amastigsp_a176881_27.p3 type:complete len:127 gc:universal Amastigsp_a176881_27:238-618(+)
MRDVCGLEHRRPVSSNGRLFGANVYLGSGAPRASRVQCCGPQRDRQCYRRLRRPRDRWWGARDRDRVARRHRQGLGPQASKRPCGHSRACRGRGSARLLVRGLWRLVLRRGPHDRCRLRQRRRQAP